VLLLAAMKVHCYCKALGPGSGCSARALLPAIRSGLGYLVRLVRARVLGARRRCAPAALPQRVREAPRGAVAEQTSEQTHGRVLAVRHVGLVVAR
jgi:hypothetical protein